MTWAMTKVAASSTTVADNPNNNITTSISGTLQSGDILFAAINVTSTRTADVTPPAGFLPLGAWVTHDSHATRLYYKVLSATTSSETFVIAGATCNRMAAYLGVRLTMLDYSVSDWHGPDDLGATSGLRDHEASTSSGSGSFSLILPTHTPAVVKDISLDIIFEYIRTPTGTAQGISTGNATWTGTLPYAEWTSGSTIRQLQILWATGDAGAGGEPGKTSAGEDVNVTLFYIGSSGSKAKMIARAHLGFTEALVYEPTPPPYQLTSRRVSARELPHEVTSRMFDDL